MAQVEQALSSRSMQPLNADRIMLASLLLSWGFLFLPTYWDLAHGTWAREEQSYGPVLLAASAWLLWRERHALASLNRQARPVPAYGLIILALLLYVLGRSQSVAFFEVGAQIPMLAGLLLLFIGKRAVRLAWAPLVLLVFTIPLPGELVVSVTGPLKSAVSAVAERLLATAGYPAGRSGVVLSIGQYRLLVADACAGLTSMFTLEALGIVYMKIADHASRSRNVVLAILLLPIAFVANVVRVIILVLITFYFGDEAGRGFIHVAAGLVLFAVATAAIIGVDVLLGLVLDKPHGFAGRPGPP